MRRRLVIDNRPLVFFSSGVTIDTDNDAILAVAANAAARRLRVSIFVWSHDRLSCTFYTVNPQPPQEEKSHQPIAYKINPTHHPTKQHTPCGIG